MVGASMVSRTAAFPIGNKYELSALATDTGGKKGLPELQGSWNSMVATCSS